MQKETTQHYTAWDIGGAHLKAARCTAAGKLIDVIELMCPLWQGINQLTIALQSATEQLHNHTDRHVITMTGELADCFENRQTGVSEILNCVEQHLPDAVVWVFSRYGLLSVKAAKQHWQAVAAMNWLASVRWLALTHPQAMFIDIGSTTTDLVCIKQGEPQLTAYDDIDRLASAELRYSGVIRTPLMAITSHAPFKGRWHTLTAEVFATMADCWCLLEQLDASSLKDNSADGKDWQIENCQRRLARMLGTDRQAADTQHWQQLAHWFAEQQIQQLTNTSLHLLSAHTSLPEDAPIIGAGIGRFVAKEIAQRLNRPYLDFMTPVEAPLAELCCNYAPAAALALLAQRELA